MGINEKTCDNCNKPMSSKDVDKMLDCKCDFCFPWVFCEPCHTVNDKTVARSRLNDVK